MLKNLSLTYKLALTPALALLGLLVYVAYTFIQLSDVDHQLNSLERESYPTLERADAVLFQFSRMPGIFNSAVTTGEQSVLDEAAQVLTDINHHLRQLEQLTEGRTQRQPQLAAWREAIDQYAANAVQTSSGLIKGESSFEELRPRRDRMATDLAPFW